MCMVTEGVQTKLVRSVVVAPLHWEFPGFIETLETSNKNTCNHLTVIILRSVTL